MFCPRCGTSMRHTHTTSNAVVRKDFWQCPRCRNNVIEEVKLIVDKPVKQGRPPKPGQTMAAKKAAANKQKKRREKK